MAIPNTNLFPENFALTEEIESRLDILAESISSEVHYMNLFIEKIISFLTCNLCYVWNMVSKPFKNIMRCKCQLRRKKKKVKLE